MTTWMTMRGFAGAGLLAVMVSPANAQAVVQVKSVVRADDAPHRRPFLVKFTADQEQDGDWREGEPLRSYAETHEGRYILFVSDGSIYRLDSKVDTADQFRELEPLHASLVALGKQQAALGAVQRPLGEQQAALGVVQRSARDAATQGSIGRAQGDVGRVQGEIGRQQGVIGRQQGMLGVAFYDRVQGMIDVCLQNKSCAVVLEAK